MKWLFSLSLLLSFMTLAAQPDSALIVANVERFQLDPIGQLYTFHTDGSLHRRDLASDSIYVFHDNLLGEITSLDVSDPFGPLLFFEDYATLLILDRTLNEVGRLRLQSSNVLQMSRAFCRNFDDRLWIFDEGDFRLKLLDRSGQLQRQSDDLRQLLRRADTPAYLWLNGTEIYLVYPGAGIARFSNFGRYLGWNEVAVQSPAFFSKRGISWQQGKDYFHWPFSGEPLTGPLPTATYGPSAQWLASGDGWFILNQKKLFYLK